MDQQTIIAELESRAAGASLAMAEVCRRAGVHPTTFSRWKASDRNTSPTGANLGSLMKIDAVLKLAEGVAEGSCDHDGRDRTDATTSTSSGKSHEVSAEVSA